MIEVEKRAVIDEKKYNELIEFFKSGKYELKESTQITTYFEGDLDFRYLKSKNGLKLWLKMGKIHDDARIEKNVSISNEYESDLESMLEILGYKPEIKWYRKRIETNYENFYVTIDYTVGYAYIFEVELSIDDKSKIETANLKIEEIFNRFNLKETEKTIMDSKYEDYKLNWKEYTKDINEEEFIN